MKNPLRVPDAGEYPPRAGDHYRPSGGPSCAACIPIQGAPDAASHRVQSPPMALASGVCDAVLVRRRADVQCIHSFPVLQVHVPSRQTLIRPQAAGSLGILVFPARTPGRRKPEPIASDLAPGPGWLASVLLILTPYVLRLQRAGPPTPPALRPLGYTDPIIVQHVLNAKFT